MNLQKTIIFILIVVLFSAGTVLAYNEAPELKEKVASGELPPVENRLPEEPFVIEPIESIGKYGGTLNTVGIVNWVGEDGLVGIYVDLITVRKDTGELIDDLTKSHSVNEDYTEFTFHLRKGLKWSDGHPFTTEDIKFNYESIIGNKEITPVIPDHFVTGGEKAELIIVDDTTFKFKFSEPNIAFLYNLGNAYAPKHYLEKYHIDFNKNANELAQEKDYEDWAQLIFAAWSDRGRLREEPEKLPLMWPFIPDKVTDTNIKFKRNPYYWKVDPERNQLPYIDSIELEIISREIYKMKAMSKEIDIAGNHTALLDYPMYKQNEEKGDYRTILVPGVRVTDPCLAVNLTHPDPELRKIFQDKRFRIALSHAINRDEINEATAFGEATTMQASIQPEASFYKEDWGKKHQEYDPEKAKTLLDEMGLVDQTGNGYRDKFNGEEFTLTIEGVDVGHRLAVYEMVERYWDSIGINTSIRNLQREFYRGRVYGGESMVGSWALGRSTELWCWQGGDRFFLPGTGNLIGFAPKWGDWLDSNGDEGEEPPEYMKHLWDIFKKWQRTPMGTEEYKELGQQIFDIHAEERYLIGTIGFVPYPLLISNKLRNVPPMDTVAKFGLNKHFIYDRREQMYFEK